MLAVLPTMHFGWGLGTLAGAVRFGAPVAALEHLARPDKPAVAAAEAEPVFAPSLHEQAG